MAPPTEGTVKLETNPTIESIAIPLNTLLQLIPEFDTAQPTQVYRFIRSCDSAFQLANTSQQTILITYALNKITGHNSSDVFARTYSCWSELRIFLIQKYSQTKTLPHLNLELQSLFQKTNESVTDFFHRVDLCRNKILEKLTAEVSDLSLVGRKDSTEETALSVFVNGVSNNLGSMLRTKGFTTLSEAGTFAIHEEKIQNMNQARQTLFKNNTKPTVYCNNTIRKPQTMAQPRPPQHTQPNSFGQTKSCNYCKKPGHLISECRKRAYNNNLKMNSVERPSAATPARVNHLNSQAAEEMGSHSETALNYCPNVATPSLSQDMAPEFHEAM